MFQDQVHWDLDLGFGVPGNSLSLNMDRRGVRTPYSPNKFGHC